MRKKAQSMSLNTIVIAALAVIVLVILSVIVMGRMGVFTRNANECPSPAKCMDDRCDDGYQPLSGKKCYGLDNEIDEYQVCCVELDVS